MKIISIVKTMREERGGYVMYLVKLEDGGLGVWKAYKPGSLFDDAGTKDFIAYLVSEKFGFDIVPECQICEFNGLIGNVQRFIEGEDGKKYYEENTLPKEQMQKLAVFDYVINNYDRCLDNFRFDKNMKVYATDNNCAFGTYSLTAETITYLFTQSLSDDLIKIIGVLKQKWGEYEKILNEHKSTSTQPTINSINRHIFQLYKVFVNNKDISW